VSVLELLLGIGIIIGTSLSKSLCPILYFIMKAKFILLLRRCSQSVALPLLLMLLASIASFGQSGKVFRDYNADGVYQATEPLIAGVIVKAYNTADAECATTTTTTVADGSGNNYSLTGCSGPVRIEFIIPAATAAVCGLSNDLDYSAYGGAGYGSSVQFTTATGTANFAIGNPHQFASPNLTNPKIFTSCYVSGDNFR
jgi:hypothetical protein